MVEQPKENLLRCGWTQTDADMIAYHDQEWGVPVSDDRLLFEFLVLEGAQAGLSWKTILKRREGYREAFEGFEPAAVARFTAKRIETLLKNPRIIRNRQKVESAVANARAFLKLQDQEGSFSDYQWRFVGNRPIQNSWKQLKELPARTEISDAFSKDLQKRGFSFVGPTIIYAHMQAVGMVNDHTVDCFRHAACRKLARSMKRSAD